MAHFAKYTKGSVGGLTKHFERAKDSEGRYYRFKNQDIDAERTMMNYNLAPHGEKQLDFIKERLEEVYCLNRDDVKVMGSWVVTVPKTVPEEHQREFFERTYDFLEKRYGKENVISAYVHMDETTPHMHFAFVPVTYDEKKQRQKVSAKEVVGKADLRSFHADLQAEMERFVEAHDYEFECDVLNGATDNGNLTVQGLKAEKLAELNANEAEILAEIVDLSNKESESLSEAIRKHDEVEGRVLKLLKLKTDLEAKIDALKGDEAYIMKQFVNSKYVKPTFDKYCDEWRKHIAEQREAKRNDERQSMAEWKAQIEAERTNRGSVSETIKERKHRSGDMER